MPLTNRPDHFLRSAVPQASAHRRRAHTLQPIVGVRLSERALFPPAVGKSHARRQPSPGATSTETSVDIWCVPDRRRGSQSVRYQENGSLGSASFAVNGSHQVRTVYRECLVSVLVAPGDGCRLLTDLPTAAGKSARFAGCEQYSDSKCCYMVRSVSTPLTGKLALSKERSS